MLKANAANPSPFIVALRLAFQDAQNLYLGLDFHAGGDLAGQLANWGCIEPNRVRFYICEIVLGLAALHSLRVIYRDLKPENILINSQGHIVLTDFGLSKAFSDPPNRNHRTQTFCGTSEYLAPEGGRTRLCWDSLAYLVLWHRFCEAKRIRTKSTRGHWVCSLLNALMTH